MFLSCSLAPHRSKTMGFKVGDPVSRKGFFARGKLDLVNFVNFPALVAGADQERMARWTNLCLTFDVGRWRKADSECPHTCNLCNTWRDEPEEQPGQCKQRTRIGEGKRG